MGFILHCCGFGCRDVTRDRLSVVSGTVTYDQVNLPDVSESDTSAGGNGTQWRGPWHDDATAGRTEPTGQFWLHMRYRTSNTTANGGLRLGVGSNSSEFVTLSGETTTNRVVLRVAGTVVATATSATFPADGTFSRVHVHMSGYSEFDTIRVYLAGNISTPVLDYTLTSGDEAALAAVGSGRPNEWYINCKSGDATQRVDDLIAFDPTASGAPSMSRLLEPSVAELIPTGNGAEQDWSGGYTDLDERPNNDADKITATAAGEVSTFTFPAIGAENVFGARLRSRVTRTGTDAGEHIGLIAINGSDDEQEDLDAPGDGDVEHIFQTAPDGSDWSPVSLDATRFGFVAVT